MPKIMKIMNKLNKYLKVGAIALAGVFSYTSCDVLDFQPATAISEVSAFETPEAIELAMVGVYNSIQSGFFAGGQIRGYPFGAAHVQQNEMRGEDMANLELFFAITYQSTYTDASANNIYMWFTLWAAINQANVVIEGVNGAISNGVLTDEIGKAYIGEAKFIRALCHHELLNHFSRPYSDNPTQNYGVPYRTIAYTSAGSVQAGIEQGRNSVAECYDLLLEDLTDAENSLPATRAGIRGKTRATQGAAIALKARVKLHMNDWPGVLAEGNKLAAQATAPFSSTIGGYAMESDPEAPFTNDTSSEWIFTVENNDVDNPGVNGALGNMLASRQAPITGRGLVAISPIFWNAEFWEIDDLRRSKLYTVDEPGAGTRRVWTYKYRDISARSDNSPVLRYAELLLSMAEAEARINGVSARAVELLNAIRNRSVLDEDKHFTVGSFASGIELIDAILKEKRIEFCAEGRRWPDIHRLAQDPNFSTGGIPAKVFSGQITLASYNPTDPPEIIPQIAAISYSDYRFLWPIPAAETAQNPTLADQQNPGW
jgi:starch-binding outer membrane protein, SusD/RagB family